MNAVLAAFDSFGPQILFVLGFAEFAGIPIASVPFLIAAGALSGVGDVGLVTVISLAAWGGLAADGMWYSLARWRGRRLVGVACSLSPNPGSCVTNVEARVTLLRAPYILAAKFMPGVGNLIAAAAGFGCYPAARFLSLDAAALLLWATAYAGLGRLFAPQVEELIETVSSSMTWIVVVGSALVIVSGIFRIFKSRGHARGHAPVSKQRQIQRGPS